MYKSRDALKHVSLSFLTNVMNETELFFNAIQQGKLENVEAQLERNSDLVNTKDTRGFTPLIFASYFDKEEMVKLLLKHNAPVDEKDVSGNTALIGVSFKGNTSLASLLIKHGANINAKNNNGVTPLIFATMYNQTKMVETLLKYNADASLKDNEGKIALDYAMEKEFKVILELFK